MPETHSEPSYSAEDPCPFCLIASKYPPQRELINPKDDTAVLEGPFLAYRGDAHIILSTPTILAFLDIMPLTRGHMLVIPRNHCKDLGETSANDMMHLGAYLPLLAKCVMRSVGWSDFNIIQNNGAAASQVVFHTHFHIVPRKSGYRRTRKDLDDQVGAQLAQQIRGEIWKEFIEMKRKRAANGMDFKQGERLVLSLL